MRQSKNRVKIFYRQEFISPGIHPLFLFLPVARRAMPVTAAMVLVVNFPAVGIIALVMMITQSGSPAPCELQKDFLAECIAICIRLSLPEDVLNGKHGYQIILLSLGMLVIWSSSLKSSSSGLTIRFRLEVCRCR